MPSARPTKIRSLPNRSGFSASAPIAALPSFATAWAAAAVEIPVAAAALAIAQRTTSGGREEVATPCAAAFCTQNRSVATTLPNTAANAAAAIENLNLWDILDLL